VQNIHWRRGVLSGLSLRQS